MHRHTGNWPGKTVSEAVGKVEAGGVVWRVVDLPGTYSLAARSPEEKLTRDFLVGEGDFDTVHVDGVIVVCDACSMCRSLRFAAEVAETGLPFVLCINLADAAERRGITIDTAKLERIVGVPCVLCAARSSAGLDTLCRRTVEHLDSLDFERGEHPDSLGHESGKRRERVKAFDPDEAFASCVSSPPQSDRVDRAIDRVLTGKYTALPCFAALVSLVFFITLCGATPISDGLSHLFSRFLSGVEYVTAQLGVHGIFFDVLCGTFDIMCRVCAVMLPPMAIFFPLFTFLEQLGFLPRVAYNFDRCFASCGACGKQALTMLMGLGCNAAGVTGCRIIDSPRERLVAMVTNAFMPCNGRLAVIMSLSSVMAACVGAKNGTFSLAVVLFVTSLGVGATFLASRILSSTCFAGSASSFTLELPPYRLPRVRDVIVRSLVERTAVVLGRAALCAAPAGLLISILSSVEVGSRSLYSHIAGALDALGRAAGLDGVMLSAFIFALPAAELTLPLMIAGYTGGELFGEAMSISATGEVFAASGVGVRSLLCAVVFTLFHFPCLTTLVTVKRESRARLPVFLSFALPTIFGYALCFVINTTLTLFGVP